MSAFKGFISFLFFLSLSSEFFQLQAAQQCEYVYQVKSPVLENLLIDPFKQWLVWEQRANLNSFQKSTAPVEFQVSEVPLRQVDVWIASSAPKGVKDMFIKKRTALMPKHIYNTSKDVPFFNLPNSMHPMSVFFTASRSVIPEDLQTISFKLPTNRPHGSQAESNDEKIKTVEDIRAAIIRYPHIVTIDEALGEDSILIILKDIAAIADKKTGNGVLVRDITPLHDGNYYLPAFSISSVGRLIAQVNKQPFEQFWQEAYARPLGQAKARLLLRYGLQMETPNPQNILIQLDPQLRPTGKIVLRDISDSQFIRPVANALGLKALVAQDKKNDIEALNNLRPFWDNSAWGFADGTNSIPLDDLKKWGLVHDQAFIEEIERSLGVRIQNAHQSQNPWVTIKNMVAPDPEFPFGYVDSFLSSPRGQKLLAELPTARSH